MEEKERSVAVVVLGWGCRMQLKGLSLPPTGLRQLRAAFLLVDKNPKWARPLSLCRSTLNSNSNTEEISKVRFYRE